MQVAETFTPEFYENLKAQSEEDEDEGGDALVKTLKQASDLTRLARLDTCVTVVRPSIQTQVLMMQD